MIEPDLNTTPRQIYQFGLMMLVFAGALGGLVLWRGDALIGAAIFLGVAWLIALPFNFLRQPTYGLGVILPGLCVAIGLPVHRGADLMTVATVVWMVGGLVGLATLLFARFGRGVFVVWMLAAEPIGWTISWIAMAVTYYVVVTPIGLLMRLLGHDPLHRQLEPQAHTYWVNRSGTTDPARYFRQF